MFKKIFKAAKDLIRSPVGQIGLGILVPGLAGSSNALLSGIGAFAKTNPALFQAGLGLASGAKPEDVLRNVALSAGTSALRGGMSGQGGVSEFFGMGQPAAKQIAPAVQNIPQGGQMTISGDASRGMENMFDAFPTEANMSGKLNLPTTTSPPADTRNFLQKMGFEITEKVNPITGEMMPVTNFFERYAPLVKLGGIGFSVAAAVLGEEQAKSLYDPNKNPYLSGDTKITDVYTPMNQGGVASFAQGGMDNLRKSGMVYGPGGPKDDLIDAKLSNGEFVFTAAAVDNAGGPQAMYKLMNSLDPESEKPGEARGIERV